MLNLTWHYFIFILELFISTFRSVQLHCYMSIVTLTRARLASIKIGLCARNHFLADMLIHVWEIKRQGGNFTGPINSFSRPSFIKLKQHFKFECKYFSP